MKLAAHTNDVGTHALNDARVNTSEGKTWDADSQSWVPFFRNDAFFSVLTDLSAKPPTYHGDFHRNTNYSRGVQKLFDDSPGKHRVSWYNPSDGVTSSYDWVETTHLSTRVQPLTSFPGIPSGILENLHAQAKTECLNKLLNEKAQIGSALGEARQTVDLFANAAKDCVRYLRAFKRGNFWKIVRRNDGKGFYKSLSDAWLEYSYGWAPLAGDVYAAQKNVHRVLSKGMAISAKRTTNYDHTAEFYRADGDYNETIHATHNVQYELGAVLQHPELAYLNTFGLINPASIAWELVPWSFAVDWFVPVGKTLEACTAAVGMDFNGGRCVEHRDYNLERRFVSGRRTPWRVCEDTGKYTEKGYAFKRTALTAWPVPELYADLTPYSTPRALNALALVKQLTH